MEVGEGGWFQGLASPVKVSLTPLSLSPKASHTTWSDLLSRAQSPDAWIGLLPSDKFLFKQTCHRHPEFERGLEPGEMGHHRNLVSVLPAPGISGHKAHLHNGLYFPIKLQILLLLF